MTRTESVAVTADDLVAPRTRLDVHVHDRVVAVAGVDDAVAGCRQYTQTAVPSGMTLLAQIQSIAAFVIRTQPCDAGYGGTTASRGTRCRRW